MLDLSINDDMMKYMKCSYDNFDRFMIFDDYTMMKHMNKCMNTRCTCLIIYDMKVVCCNL